MLSMWCGLRMSNTTIMSWNSVNLDRKPTYFSFLFHKLQGAITALKGTLKGYLIASFS